MMSFSFEDLKLGVLLGLLCILGLTLGVYYLFKASKKDLERPKATQFTVLGIFFLVSQFFAAGYFVYLVAPRIEDPLSFGAGLIGTVLVVSAGVRFFQKAS